MSDRTAGTPARPRHAADRLEAAVAATESVACVGLDPRPELLPPALRRAALDRHGDGAEAVAEAFLAFNLGILDAVAGRCPVVKPQVACYEAYGAAGWRTLEATVAAAGALGLQVIVDGKRNDIGSTATHYAQAAFGGAPGLDGARLPGLGGDWLTVNGYLGGDAIDPFLGDAADTDAGGHGIFVLVRTSNPSAADLQDRVTDTGTVADAMAELVTTWGRGRVGSCGLSAVGAVVGATWPDQARELRGRMPDAWFLVPGYGAQGGSAADAVAGARPSGPAGLLVNSSRQILAAWQHDDEADWVGSARRALDAMNADLGTALAGR